jgi:cob(I)alamin adenosyltransferase
VSEGAIHWINRLSDLLFAMARQSNHVSGIADVPWVPAKRE